MLIGRTRELDEIREALEQSRVVTLIGPGGVGKTSLAVAVASEAGLGSALFAELTPLGAEDLADGLAGSVGFASFDDLASAVHNGEQLMVLDNCEHVLDAAADITQRLLATNPGLTILATSRERLDVVDERVIAITPLSTDGHPSPATRMFLHAVEARGIDSDDDLHVVDELCRRLDGLPLALELAAARASAMTAAEMIANLDSRLDLLSRSRARGPARHHSLRAAIAWSYQQLPAPAQEFFARLSVFRAPFTAELAAGATGVDDATALVTLAALVDRSLLVHEPVAGISWYRMLETIRAFATERLDLAGDRVDTEERVLEHLAQFADRIDEKGVMSGATVPAELERSFRNVRWAVDRSLERDDRDRTFRLVAPLWWLEDVGHQAEGSDLIERVVARWPEVTLEGARAWGILSCLSRQAGRADRARHAAEIASSGSGLGAAYGERTLGHLARTDGRWAAALDHFARGAAAARAGGHEAMAMELEMHTALTHARADDVDDAVAVLESVMARSDDYPLTYAWAANFLAYILLDQDPARAAEIARSLQPIAASTNNRWLIGSTETTLGLAALSDGDPAAAARHFAESIDSFMAIRSGTDIGIAQLGAAALFASAGDIDTAKGVLAAERSTGPAVLGDFERRIYDRLGRLPEIPPDQPALPLDEVARRLRAVAAGSSSRSEPAVRGNMFRRRGDSWSIVFAGTEILQRDSKGLSDIARLLARPGVEIAAVDLMGALVVEGDAGAASDAAARQDYRARIEELQEDVDRAEADGDSYAAERAREQLDALVDHLSAVYGLGGKDRPQSATAEKARSAVTWRIRAAIKRIAEAHPQLGDHLDRSIATGRFCVYEPDAAIEWQV